VIRIVPAIPVSHFPLGFEGIAPKPLRPLARLPHPGQSLIEVVHEVVASCEGPIPAPSILRSYDEIVPGAAERIIAMAEREQEHRHAWERGALSAKPLVPHDRDDRRMEHRIRRWPAARSRRSFVINRR
jgi:hypothetical protein